MKSKLINIEKVKFSKQEWEALPDSTKQSYLKLNEARQSTLKAINNLNKLKGEDKKAWYIIKKNMVLPKMITLIIK